MLQSIFCVSKNCCKNLTLQSKNKEEDILRKIGIVELNTTNIKMTFANISDNQSFVITDQFEEATRVAYDLLNGELIKPATIQTITSTLKSYKTISIASGISEVFAVASNEYTTAKNQKSFFEELYSQGGFKFQILGAEEQTYDLYLSFINSLDAPKGLIVSVNGTNSQILAYNRRNIINQKLISESAIELAEKYTEKLSKPEDFMKAIQKEYTSKINKIDFFDGLDAETQIVGTGDAFTSLARLSRKVNHYSYDREHGYRLTSEDLTKVLQFLKGLELDKSKRLKGISNERVDILVAEFCIIKAISDASKIENIIVSKNGVSEGLLFAKACPQTLEKPITDVLGYSLDALNEQYNVANIKNTKNICELSLILFKQLKVLHKLPRTFVKVLKIASYFHDCGKRISYQNYQKKGFNVVLNSDIYGASHREQVLAGFVVASQNLEDFNMTEWVKYKDLFSDEDLEGVRKLAVIVKLASSFDAFNTGKVKDISCDILGDSVIMKTIVDSPADMEIAEGLKVSSDFAKAFKKHLEIL